MIAKFFQTRLGLTGTGICDRCSMPSTRAAHNSGTGWTLSSLIFSQTWQVCEKVTRPKLLGKQLGTGRKPFAAFADGCRHAVRISHGGVRNAGSRAHEIRL